MKRLRPFKPTEPTTRGKKGKVVDEELEEQKISSQLIRQLLEIVGEGKQT